MKKSVRRTIGVFVFFMFLGFAHDAWCQTSSLVSGNIPQDQSRVAQDIVQLNDDEMSGNVHAVPQDVAFLNAQQQILINDQNSIQSFQNIATQAQTTMNSVQQFNNRNGGNQRMNFGGSNNGGFGNLSASVNALSSTQPHPNSRFAHASASTSASAAASFSRGGIGMGVHGHHH